MEKAIAALLIFAIFGFVNSLQVSDPPPPHIRIVEIKKELQSTREGEHILNKPPNSYVVVGQDIQANSKVLFECDAQYPVQWVYTGPGMPEYYTNTSSTSHTRPAEGLITRPGPLFMASLTLGLNKPIGPQDSGKYICRSLQTVDLNSFYYLYDKGKFLTCRFETFRSW